jgi:predicted RNA polymerase sigma factor
MAQRISRAKQTSKSSSVPFRMPTGSERVERLRSVLHVLYLIFNEGYVSSSGSELARSELSGEAIRLTRIVRMALPDDPEVAGLLALMLLTEARRPARTDGRGELIPLAEQDRTLWNQDLIAEGSKLLGFAVSRGAAGEYQFQRRSPRRTTRHSGRRTRTGARSSASTDCSNGLPTTRWSPSTAQSPPGWSTGRGPDRRS